MNRTSMAWCLVLAWALVAGSQALEPAWTLSGESGSISDLKYSVAISSDGSRVAAS